MFHERLCLYSPSNICCLECKGHARLWYTLVHDWSCPHLPCVMMEHCFYEDDGLVDYVIKSYDLIILLLFVTHNKMYKSKVIKFYNFGFDLLTLFGLGFLPT